MQKVPLDHAGLGPRFQVEWQDYCLVWSLQLLVVDEARSTKAVGQQFCASIPGDIKSIPAGRTRKHWVCSVRRGGDVGNPDYPPASLSCLCPVYCLLLAASEGNKSKGNFESCLPIILLVLGPGLCSATQAGTEAASCRDMCWRWGLGVYPGPGPVLGILAVPSKHSLG